MHTHTQYFMDKSNFVQTCTNKKFNIHMLYTSNNSRAIVLTNSTSSSDSQPHDEAMLTNVVSKNTVSDVRFLIMQSTNCSRIAGSVSINTIITLLVPVSYILKMYLYMLKI